MSAKKDKTEVKATEVSPIIYFVGAVLDARVIGIAECHLGCMYRAQDAADPSSRAGPNMIYIHTCSKRSLNYPNVNSHKESKESSGVVLMQANTRHSRDTPMPIIDSHAGYT